MEYRLLKILAKDLQESENNNTIDGTEESKTVTKYEIIEDTFELRQNTPHAAWTAEEVVDGYLRGNLDGRIIGSYDDLETAVEAFDALEPDTWEGHGCPFWFIHGTIYRLEENEYIDDEFNQGNFLEFKAKEFKE